MIEIYLKDNTNYNSNGDITLKPTSCVYKDSEQEVILEHPLDDEGRWKYINYENVISAEDNGKKKLYRIYNIVKSLYYITAYAKPIFYDLIDNVLLDVRPTLKTAEEALNVILADTPFTGHSNIHTINTSYYVRKNIVEALLGDDENSFINRWGGEFYCENFDIYINDMIGSDNDVRVEFGYNLNEIEEDINIEEVVTRIIPVGFNGIMLDGKAPWIDSPLINKYIYPKTRVIEFSDIKVKEKAEDKEGFETVDEAREALKGKCIELFNKGIDKPIVNYKIDMINLYNTTAYKDFKHLVHVGKGDVITCYIKHLDIDVKARVIDFEKDLLTGEYISIELGNASKNFFKEQADIQSKVNNILNGDGTVKANSLNGTIDALQTQFKAMRDVAQPQEVLAMMFEDRVTNSPTFGAMAIGTMGFMIASQFKPGTEEWDFRTFGTGQGFSADLINIGILNATLIKTGILSSFNEKSWLNMDDGTFNFGGKLIYDGFKIRALELEAERALRIVETSGYSPQVEFYRRGDDQRVATIVGAIYGDMNGGIHIQGFDSNSTKKPIYLEGSALLFENLDVVSSGSNANGTWVRYYDGTQICYGNFNMGDDIGFTTLSGGVYTNSTYSNKSYVFPASFTTTPVVKVSASSNGYLTSALGNVTTTAFVGRLYSHASLTIKEVKLNYISIGRWK